jgi:peptidoglycan DL-endopeptidase CwlO
LFAGRVLLRALLIGTAAVAVVAPASAALAAPTLPQIEDEIEQKSDEVEKVIEAYNQINDDLADTQAKLADLATKMQPLQANMDSAQANVSQIARAAYRGGNLRTVSVLLSAGSASTFVDQLATLDQLSRSQSRDIATYTNARKVFADEKARLDQLLATQNAQKAELEVKKTKIEGEIAKLEDLHKKAIAAGRKTTAANSNGGTTVPPPSVSGSAGKAVAFAYAQLGKPYKWGGDGIGEVGFDCSGLTQQAWLRAGVKLPHNAAAQWNQIKHIPRSALAAGDLVFYNSLGHVGIYIGGGNIIHSPHTGDVVRIAGVDRSKPYGYGRPG